MSASPPKEDVEQPAESPPDDPDAQMNPDQQSSNPQDVDVKEQDRWLPIANVARIMKIALPENAKIAKEAKECMQECVSEFIAFITSEGAWSIRCTLIKFGNQKASEKCQIEKRKTVNGEDILFAMTSLGFENYAETLKIYLSKYRETQTSRGENRPGSQGFGPGTVAEVANTDANINANADADANTDINQNPNSNVNVNPN
ncbi:hypothetical protein EPUL_001295, partial [Erysiphe pulchra]